MRQLITRIDDDLHDRLRARARAEGRSMASLVREVLGSAVDRNGDQQALRGRVARSGLVLRPDAVATPPSRDAVLRQTRGVGKAASDALSADRATR